MKDEIHINDLNNKVILITGSAGFIGYHLIVRLLKETHNSAIIGVDNFSDYYDVSLKEWRCGEIDKEVSLSDSSYELIRGTISDKTLVEAIFDEDKPDIVINLAAQAGVRYSIVNPDAYIESNIIGFYNILEACRHSSDNGRKGVEHLVFASSSSVYGGNTKIPFSIEDKTDSPVSLYAATKKSDELMAYCYSKLYDIPTTGLRFFTVYGPAGRPDMAYYSFAEKLRTGQKIDIFNYGNCKRDFTYVSDIVNGIMCVIRKAPMKEDIPYAVYNIGGGQPENLMDFVQILTEEMISVGILKSTFDLRQCLNMLPMQSGDVPVTYADSSGLERDFGFKPETDIRTGLRGFVRWYADYIEKKSH